MNGRSGSCASASGSTTPSGSSSWKFGITTAGAPGTWTNRSRTRATKRLTACVSVTSRRSNRAGPVDAGHGGDALRSPVSVPRAGEALAELRAGAELPFFADESADGAEIAVVAGGEQERHLRAEQADRHRVGDPAIGVDQVRLEVPHQAAEAPCRLGIGEGGRVVLVGVLGHPSHPTAEVADPVHAQALVLVRRRRSRLPGGGDLDGVAALCEVPREQLDTAYRPTDQRAVVVGDDQRAQRPTLRRQGIAAAPEPAPVRSPDSPRCCQRVRP